MIRYNFLSFAILFCFHFSSYSFDLSLIGFINQSDGIGSYIPLFLSHFSKEFSIQVIDSRKEEKVTGALGSVIFFTGLLFENESFIDSLKKSHAIKIAFSTFESTVIPKNWVKKLNTIFDGVCVTDPFLEVVYKKSGVTIPIFCLPPPVSLHNFYVYKKKKAFKRSFRFGMTGDSWPHKNHILLARAFALEFDKNSNVELFLHSKCQVDCYKKELKQFFDKNKIPNIHVVFQKFSAEQYQEFLSSLDCYVLLSQGEGFSITPRQALALGIPCILSCNSAHKTLCNSGFVYSVKAEKALEPLYLKRLFSKHEFCGYQFDCDIKDVQKALRKVYENYNYYLAQTEKAKEWVMCYDFAYLKHSYRSFIKPVKIIFGLKNSITADYLETNSVALYKKYKKNEVI